MKTQFVLSRLGLSHTRKLLIAACCIAATACVADYDSAESNDWKDVAQTEDALVSSGTLACGQSGTVVTNSSGVTKECTIEAWNECGSSSTISFGGIRILVPKTQNGNTTDVIGTVNDGASIEFDCCPSLEPNKTCGWTKSNCVTVVGDKHQADVFNSETRH